jgi:hypothetical protein
VAQAAFGLQARCRLTLSGTPVENRLDGLCAGVAECVPAASGQLKASFAKKAPLTVERRGDGVVELSTGKVCNASSCEYLLDAPATLKGKPAGGSRFAGFAGACSGTADCTVQQGLVVAVFEQAPASLQIVFEGNGAGEVSEPGGLRCRSSCALEVVAGQPYSFVGGPDTGTLPAVFSGDCTGTTCRVVAPAVVRVRFDKGRFISVGFQGRGSGTVSVNGEVCSSSCAKLIPPENTLTIKASSSNASRFEGFSGDCIGLSDCALAAGTAPVTVNASFDKVLQWVRSFPNRGTQSPSYVSAVLIDAQGIALAATGGDFEVDGRVYGSTWGSERATLIEVGWDAGTHFTFSTLSESDAGGSSNQIYSFARGDAGELFGFGMCVGDTFLGQPCGYDSHAVAFAYLDGGFRPT